MQIIILLQIMEVWFLPRNYVSEDSLYHMEHCRIISMYR